MRAAPAKVRMVDAPRGALPPSTLRRHFFAARSRKFYCHGDHAMPRTKPIDDEPLLDPTEELNRLRHDILPELYELNENWKRCDKPRCRRVHRCCAEMICTAKPRRPVTREEAERALADLEKYLERRRAPREALNLGLIRGAR
jgi:hypothetical protein